MKNLKINTILLIALIGLVIVGIVILSKKDNSANNITEVQDIKPTPITTDTTEEYASQKLGFSFEYPKEWGTVKEDMGQDKNGFIYIVSFTNAKVAMQGLSYPYPSEGRETFEADLKESDLNDTCEKNINEPVFTKDGTEGVYTYALITTGMGDCSDYDTRHFAVFDVNKKVTNIVITANKEMDIKLFKDFVSSITINK